MATKSIARISGLKETQAALGRLGKKAPKALGKALFKEAEVVMAASKLQTPVDIGPLKDSGFVDFPKISLSGVGVELGFGSPTIDYALVQHERMDFAHTVGKAKYLEDPFKAALRNLDGRLAKRLRREIPQVR